MTGHIRSMLHELCMALHILNEDTRQTINRTLREYWKDKVVVTYSTLDVHYLANDREHAVSESDAMYLLDRLREDLEAGENISQDTLERYLETEIEQGMGREFTAEELEDTPYPVIQEE